MLKIKELFCKHIYKKVSERQSEYTSDYNCFSDLGWYNDVIYKCEKCGKEKILTIKNEKHPCYCKWEKV